MHQFFWVTALRAPTSSIDWTILTLSFVVSLPPLSRYGGFVHKSIARGNSNAPELLRNSTAWDFSADPFPRLSVHVGTT